MTKLVLLGTLCSATAALAAPSDDQRALDAVTRWAAAQNHGDFAAYGALYAPVFHGVRRTRLDRVELDRAGWMKDRARMFKHPMKVTVASPTVVKRGGELVVELEQTFEQGRFHDHGKKRLVLDGKTLLVTREEMLESLSPHATGRGTTCQDDSRDLGDGVLVLHICVVGEKHVVKKWGEYEESVRKPTLLWTPKGKAPVSADLEETRDGFEWGVNWHLAEVITDPATGAHAVLVVRDLGGANVEVQERVEARLLAPSMPLLWKTQDWLGDTTFEVHGATAVIEAQHAPTEDAAWAFEADAPKTRTTLTFTNGRIVAK